MGEDLPDGRLNGDPVPVSCYRKSADRMDKPITGFRFSSFWLCSCPCHGACKHDGPLAHERRRILGLSGGWFLSSDSLRTCYKLFYWSRLLVLCQGQTLFHRRPGAADWIRDRTNSVELARSCNESYLVLFFLLLAI